MGLRKEFSSVAGAKMLGNSCNLHKSKMAAIDRGGLQLFHRITYNHMRCLFSVRFVPEESISKVNFLIWGEIRTRLSKSRSSPLKIVTKQQNYMSGFNSPDF